MAELAFISLGSNIDPEQNLPLAITRLHQLGRLLASSKVYQNPAITPEPQPDYLNAAVLIETDLSPLEIRGHLRDIEHELGRVRTADKNAARTIDLDLCLFSDLQIQTPDLALPDPDILGRPHLAITLSELRPDQIYPGSDLKLSEIAARLRPGSQLTERPDFSLSNSILEGADG